MLIGGIAALLTALAPALFAVKAEVRLPSGIARHGLGGSARNRRTSQIMISVLIAACLLVVAGASLLVDSVLHLETDALGSAPLMLLLLIDSLALPPSRDTNNGPVVEFNGIRL
jgi:hypothetical protein